MSSLADALSTHPPAKERIIQMGELEAATPKTSNQITSTPEFEKAKARSIQFAKK